MRKNQSGSAIIMLFIAVALFGALAYAFIKGSRTSTSFLTDEQSKANVDITQGQNMIVNQAVKRLTLRGCKASEISYETPAGNDVNPLAPADGRCHIYKVNGGGIRFTGNDVAAGDPCTTGPIGSVCSSDGAVYIGDMSGNRIYVRNTDSSASTSFSSGLVAHPNSMTDGLSNTNALISSPPGGFSYAAATLCRGHGPDWYLPAKNELNLLQTNSGSINLPSIGITTGYYWSSSQDAVDPNNVHWQRFSPASTGTTPKFIGNAVRCVRR